MAIATFELILPKLFIHEGGFVNHPKDPGGATNMGITLRTLAGFLGDPKTTVQRLKEMTKAEAAKIYKIQYWDKVHGDRLPAGLDYAVFDFAVNSGTSRAVKELQKIVGAGVDGIIGFETLSKVKSSSLNPKQLANELCKARLAFMKRLKHWPTFKNGWSRRVEEVRQMAVSLVGKTFVDVEATPMQKTLSTSQSQSNPPSKAKDDDVSFFDGLLKLDMLPQIIAALSGAGIFAGNGPLQWAFAIVLVGSVGAGIYMLLKAKKASI